MHVRILTICACLGFSIFTPNIIQSAEPITSSRCNVFTFDATGSYDPDHHELTFHWDFGDGTQSQDPVVEHTYAKPGIYTVSLKILDETGSQCNTALADQKISVSIPPFASFSIPSRICAQEDYVYDASASKDVKNGKQLTYDWNFGDGDRSTRKVITKKYQKGGVYNIRLTVDDGSNQVCSKATVERPIYVNEPPQADAGMDVLTRCIDNKNDLEVVFDGTKSSDANNDQLTYQWQFGDGRTAQGATIKHKYRSTGVYDVQLKVTDGSQLHCDASVDYIRVRLDNKPEAKVAEEIAGCVEEDIFFDGGSSYAGMQEELLGQWNLGDGTTKTGLNVTHRYKKPGTYKAELKIENALNEKCPSSKDTTRVFINAAPSVTLKATEAVCLGETVYFDASSAIDPNKDKLEFYWNFGDGHIITAGPKVHHIYQAGGEYRVSVIVDDGRVTNCSTATAFARVKVNAPPVANPGPNLACCVNKPTDFNGASSFDPDGDTLTYAWDFGDGRKATGVQAQHTFRSAGKYQVSLTVDDGLGTVCSSDKARFTAVVNTQPVAVMDIK